MGGGGGGFGGMDQADIMRYGVLLLLLLLLPALLLLCSCVIVIVLLQNVYGTDGWGWHGRYAGYGRWWRRQEGGKGRGDARRFFFQLRMN